MDYRPRYPFPLRALSAAIDAALAVGGAAIVVVVFVNAVLRGAAGFDLAWSLEATAFLLLWVTFLGCAAAVARGAHMRVTEIVTLLVPSRAQRPLALAIDLAVAAMLIALVVFGQAIAARTWAQQTTVLYWPVGLLYASMPVGVGLSLVFHFANMALDWRDGPPMAASGDGAAASNVG